MQPNKQTTSLNATHLNYAPPPVSNDQSQTYECIEVSNMGNLNMQATVQPIYYPLQMGQVPGTYPSAAPPAYVQVPVAPATVVSSHWPDIQIPTVSEVEPINDSLLLKSLGNEVILIQYSYKNILY